MSEFRYYSNYGYRRPRRRRKPGTPRLTLLRVRAEVRVDERVLSTRVFLNEIFPKALFFFSSEPLRPDSEVAIAIEAPRQFYAVGRVVSCSPYLRYSRVIETARYPFRVAMAFEFHSELDAEEVRAYVSDLRARFVFK